MTLLLSYLQNDFIIKLSTKWLLLSYLQMTLLLSYLQNDFIKLSTNDFIIKLSTKWLYY